MQGYRGASSCGKTAEILILGFAGALFSPPGARAQVVINEVLAQNRMTNTDEDGDASDWLELYNAGAAALDLKDYALSDDLDNLRQWVFPALTLDPRSYFLVWCSGKNRHAPPPELIFEPDSLVPLLANLISSSDPWRYLPGTPFDSAPPGWFLPNFDDSRWRSARPAFGSAGAATQLPAGTNTVFFRRTFHLDSPQAMTSLILQAKFSHGLVVYLNGFRILSVNFPETQEPTFDVLASNYHNPGTAVRFDLLKYSKRLRPGENYLAIALLNLKPGSESLYLLPELGIASPILHTSFRLGRNGENLLLLDPRNQIADSLLLPAQNQDHSYGRFPDGSGEFFYFGHPTPQHANDSSASSQPIPDRVEVSPEAGKYPGQLEIAMQPPFPFPDLQIRYTLNGAPPTGSSPLYQGPLSIQKSTVVRAAGFLMGQRATAIATRSYFIGAGRFELPILSLSMDPQDFYAVHMDEQRGTNLEKGGFLEIITAEGKPGAGSGAGLRLHGGGSRGGGLEVKKSYRTYFRQIYGDKKLKYRVIPDAPFEEYDKLVLRAGFLDSFRFSPNGAYIRDEIVRDLHEEMGSVISHGSWYNLFVNMEYRGLYNVVERLDDDFLNAHLNSPGELWDLIDVDYYDGQAQEGTIEEFNRFLEFMNTNDWTREINYQEGIKRLDLENFTSYMILEAWSQNMDWPGNNWVVARPRRPDGKWSFIIWDAEAGFSLDMDEGHQLDTFSQLIGGGTPLTQILTGLFVSPSYQTYFLEQLDRYFDGSLSPENVLKHVERLREAIKPDMPEEAGLFQQSLEDWLRAISRIENFVKRRNPALREIILNSPLVSVSRVLKVVPDKIEPAGEVEVRLVGRNFTRATRIFFEEIPSPKVTFLTSLSLKATVPYDLRLEGFPAITASDPAAGTYQARNLLAVSFPQLHQHPFRRGDVNGSGSTNVSDAILLLRHLFGGWSEPACPAALDADDSGAVDITDAIVLLLYLFQPGSPALPPPVNGCGLDPTPDELPCAGQAGCP